MRGKRGWHPGRVWPQLRALKFTKVRIFRESHHPCHLCVCNKAHSSLDCFSSASTSLTTTPTPPPQPSRTGAAVRTSRAECCLQDRGEMGEGSSSIIVLPPPHSASTSCPSSSSSSSLAGTTQPWPLLRPPSAAALAAAASDLCGRPPRQYTRREMWLGARDHHHPSTHAPGGRAC